MDDRLLKKMLLEAIQETLGEDDAERKKAKEKYDATKRDYLDMGKHHDKLDKKYDRAKYNRNEEVEKKLKQLKRALSNLYSELDKLNKEYKFMEDEWKDTHFTGF